MILWGAGTPDLAAPRAAGQSPCARFGRGIGHAHHGEFLQGAFRDQEGAVRAALVSVPLAGQTAHATFRPARDRPLTINPPSRPKALAGARVALKHLARADMGGHLDLSTTIPTGKGFGASTADVTAALGAVFGAFGQRVGRAQIARLAVQAEVASDPTMFEGPVLFAQRDGDVMEEFQAPLPALRAIGVDVDPGGTVDTLSLTQPLWGASDIDTYGELRLLLRRAINAGDASLIGHVASQSALMSAQTRAFPRLGELLEIARDAGGVGVQIAHSGTIAALLFDGRAHDGCERQTRGETMLREARFSIGHRFRI